jgi:hypothetical protein
VQAEQRGLICRALTETQGILLIDTEQKRPTKLVRYDSSYVMLSMPPAQSTLGTSLQPLALRERFFFFILCRRTALQALRLGSLSPSSVSILLSSGLGLDSLDSLNSLGLPLGLPTVIPSTLGLRLAGISGGGGLDKCLLNVKRFGPELG